MMPSDHPINRPVLPALMLMLLTVGAVFALAYSGGYSSFAIGAAAVVSLACFVALFTLYWVGWFIRETDSWRDRQRDTE